MEAEDLKAQFGVDDLAAANRGVGDLAAFSHARRMHVSWRALVGFPHFGWKNNQRWSKKEDGGLSAIF